MERKTAICPGSFDPITLGHLDIIRRASKLFDKVIVLVTVNLNKTAFFTKDERVGFIKKSVSNIDNVSVDCCDGILADYIEKAGACAIVKGLRAVSDFDYEFQMALANKTLNNKAETVFLTTRAANLYLSSSLVRQIGSMGGDISKFVPDCILGDILKKMRGNV